MGLCKILDVNCVSQIGTFGTLGIIIFYTLEPPAVQKYSICWVFLAFCHVLYLFFVNLYLCKCICVFDRHFSCPWTLWLSKNTCWVFPALHHRLYLCICEFVFVYLKVQNIIFDVLGPLAFKNIALQGFKRHFATGGETKKVLCFSAIRKEGKLIIGKQRGKSIL